MDSPPYEIKDIPGYEGQYQATSSGDIFSLLRNKFLSLGDDSYGYSNCSLRGKTFKVHKLIALTFLTKPSTPYQIDHINHDRKDNRVSNLRYTTVSENQLHKRPRVPKSSELKYITVKQSTFKVVKNTKGLPTVYKSFKTLAEAQTFRDALLNEQKTPVQPDAL